MSDGLKIWEQRLPRDSNSRPRAIILALLSGVLVLTAALVVLVTLATEYIKNDYLATQKEPKTEASEISDQSERKEYMDQFDQMANAAQEDVQQDNKIVIEEKGEANARIYRHKQWAALDKLAAAGRHYKWNSQGAKDQDIPPDNQKQQKLNTIIEDVPIAVEPPRPPEEQVSQPSDQKLQRELAALQRELAALQIDHQEIQRQVTHRKEEADTCQRKLLASRAALAEIDGKLAKYSRGDLLRARAGLDQRVSDLQRCRVDTLANIRQFAAAYKQADDTLDSAEYQRKQIESKLKTKEATIERITTLYNPDKKTVPVRKHRIQTQ